MSTTACDRTFGSACPKHAHKPICPLVALLFPRRGRSTCRAACLRSGRRSREITLRISALISPQLICKAEQGSSPGGTSDKTLLLLTGSHANLRAKPVFAVEARPGSILLPVEGKAASALNSRGLSSTDTTEERRCRPYSWSRLFSRKKPFSFCELPAI